MAYRLHDVDGVARLVRFRNRRVPVAANSLLYVGVGRLLLALRRRTIREA